MDVYGIVTSRIMELLEAGEVPWRKPWNSSGGPMNLVSKKPYRGVNSFLLNCAPYGSPYWLTYRQAEECGGHVRKGEKSTLIVFWKWMDRRESDVSEDASSDSSAALVPGRVPMLRHYCVFNLEQVDGIEPPKEEQPTCIFNPIEQAELIIEGMPKKPSIKYGGDLACYSPTLDSIKLPKQKAFRSAEEFYSTAFHELAHATGHSSRLNRKGVADPSRFGSHDYSQEELVAEFGAAMLCAVAGIEQQVIANNAAYIQGWLKVLKGDKKLAVIAAGQAQRAADFILNRQPEQD